MNMIWKLLRKNISIGQLLGFLLSNIVGLSIVIIGVQLYVDASQIFQNEDSFIKKDYIVINKEVHSSDLLAGDSKEFLAEEIAEIESQEWVRKVGAFQSATYKLYASVGSGNRAMSTYMFFESLPREFIDVKDVEWDYVPGDRFVPIIISKDYLNLYNFGFASSSGLPRLSENMLGSIPLTLQISGNGQSATLVGRVVGFSNRLNTILVPEEFMRWSNSKYGEVSQKARPSRLIIDVNSPGDVRIGEYMSKHNYEVAGEQDGATAAYLLKIIVGIIVAVGLAILLLSFGILLLSISLLMQKNRDKIHSLIMLGYDLSVVGRPYKTIVMVANSVALLVSVVCMLLFRFAYIEQMQSMGAGEGNVWVALFVGLAIAIIVSLFNVVGITRNVRKSFR